MGLTVRVGVVNVLMVKRVTKRQAYVQMAAQEAGKAINVNRKVS